MSAGKPKRRKSAADPKRSSIYTATSPTNGELWAKVFAEAQKRPAPIERINRVHNPQVAPEVLDGLKALAAKPITLELPLPPRVLHPNARTKSYGYRAAKTKEARDTATFIASRNRPPQPFKHATIQATFYVAKQNDGSNLNSWLKASVDGLQGICIVNDRDITLLPPEQVTGVPVGQRRVVLTITPTDRCVRVGKGWLAVADGDSGT